MVSARRALLWAGTLGTLGALAACGASPRSDEVTLGGGMLGPTSWGVSAYESADYGRCVQVRFEAAEQGAVCVGAGDGLGTLQQDDPAGGGAVVVVDLGDDGWTNAVVTLDDRSTIAVTPVASGHGRYLVFAVPAPRRAELIDLLDAVGGQMERRSLQ